MALDQAAMHRPRPDRWTYKARDQLLRSLLPGLEWLATHTPRALFAPAARLVAVCFYALLGRERRILRENLIKVLGLAPGSAELRRTMLEVGRYQVLLQLETVRNVFDPGAVTCEGREELDRLVQECLDAGRGFLLVTGHLGSWELVARATAAATGGRFHILAKKSRSGPATDLLTRLRAESGVHVLWNDSRRLLRDMLSVLQRGEGLGLAMDQKPKAYQGPVVDFFGYPTEFVSGPAALAARTGCPVIAVFALRVGSFRYRLRCERLLPAGHGRTDENELTQLMASAIERRIREAPEQWTWSYRRWLFEGRATYRAARPDRS